MMDNGSGAIASRLARIGTMWNDLMHLQISLPDKIVRTVAVYLLLAVILRLVGKRDLAQLNAFDLVVMLLLSNVVQNAVIGPDNSLLGGAIGAVVLIAVNAAVVRLVRRSDRLARVMEGTATVLARDGRWDEARASVSLDLSGRPFLAFEADLPPGGTGNFDHELTEEFFRAVSSAARMTLHVTVETGTNAHHMIEAAFKAFARALRAAVAIDPTETGVPSTKGTLTS